METADVDRYNEGSSLSGHGYTVSSVISILCCTFVVVSYFLLPSLKRVPSALLMVFTCLFSMAFYITSLIELYTDDTRIGCIDVSPYLGFFLLGQELYLAMMALDLKRAIKNPFGNGKFTMILYNIFVWTASAFSSIGLWSTGHRNGVTELGFCWADSDLERQQLKLSTSWALPLFIVPMTCVYAYSIIISAYVTSRLTVGLPESISVRKSVVNSLRLYVTSSTIYWIAIAALYIHISENSNSTVTPVILRTMFGAKGILYGILWLFVTTNVMKNDGQTNGVNWALRREMLYLLTNGIREAAASSSSLGDEKEVSTFSLDGVYESKVTFLDYFPSAFRKVRLQSAIDDVAYQRSMECPNAMVENFGEGKSQAFMYYTRDKRFVIKTCTEEELSYLRNVLPAYISHLETNPSSYLCRYVGLHQIVLYKHVVSVVVMESIFPPNQVIHERFDLKGSWVGRNTKSLSSFNLKTCIYCEEQFKEEASNTKCLKNPIGGGGGHKAAGNISNTVGKDINWQRTRQVQMLNSFAAHELVMQLRQDVEFLKSISSIDYSLLVGIHYKEESCSTSTPLCSSSLVHITAGGETNECEATMFVGVIDILTPWSFRKRAERFYRVYIQGLEKNGISCAKPEMYARRFRKNVVDRLSSNNINIIRNDREPYGGFHVKVLLKDNTSGDNTAAAAIDIINHHDHQYYDEDYRECSSPSSLKSNT